MATQFGVTAEYRASVKAPTIVHFELGYDAPAGTYTIPVKAGTFVHSVGVVVKTAFNSTTPTLTAGDGADADGYLDSADIAPATAADATTPAVKLAKDGGNPYANGKYYAVDDTIDFAFVPGTLDATPTGRLLGFVIMSNVKNDGIEA